MLINNPDALKTWLTAILKPLCEADPAALAKYVLALLRKDKSMADLTQMMSEQLDVFLGVETEPFLERLFAVIKSEEYLKSVGGNSSNLDITKQHQQQQLQPKIPAVTSAHSVQNMKPEELSTSDKSKDCELNAVQINFSSKSNELSPTKTESLVRETRRRQGIQRSRSRSRSRSHERPTAIRSRSRDMRERDRNNRQYRNKSPPGGDRRRRDSSPKGRGKVRMHSRSKSRSRSPSVDVTKISRSLSPVNHNRRLTKRQRCRDFDEKGYCILGNTCPWDHGEDPVVLEDINNPALIGIQSGSNFRGGEYSPDAPELWNRGTVNFMGSHNTMAANRNGTGLPNMPFQRVAPFPYGVNSNVTTPLQRELISVPVVDANGGGDVSNQQVKRRYEPEDIVAVPESAPKRRLPINSRLGPRIMTQQNCSLELRKVPRGLNSITHLNDHFSKFGKIVNIQITYDGDPEAAIVTFSTHAEANVAYRSTEAVLNNRFIKVLWHTATSNSSAQGTLGMKDDTTPIRNKNQYHLNNVVAAAVPSATDASKTAGNIGQNVTVDGEGNIQNGMSQSTILPNPSALRTKNSRILLKKKQEEQAKNTAQLVDVSNKKHELLQKYLKEMHSLLEMMERSDNDTHRNQLKEAIKGLQSSVDRLQGEIKEEQDRLSIQAHGQGPVRKTKDQRHKELLDMELELIKLQQEGKDTGEIQKKMESLQRTYSGGAIRPPFPPRPSRVRPAAPGSTSVDRRPTTLNVIGFAECDIEDVIGHLKHFGEITKNVIDIKVPSVTVTFATRLHAEQAMLRGKLFKEKALQISWVVAQPNNPTVQKVIEVGENSIIKKPEPIEEPNVLESVGLAPDTGVKSDPQEINIEDEEEEEETENEHRSWRRG